MKSFKAIFRRGQNSKFDGGDNLSRTSSSTTLDSDQRSNKGAKSKKDSSRERVDRFVENKEAKVFPKIDKVEPDDDTYPSIDSLQEEELPQLRKQLHEMAQEKSSLAFQLGEQKGQLKQLHNEIQILKSFQEESNLQLEHLTEENATLRNRLRDVVHSPLSDNEKQQLLFDTQRQHSSAPSSIATNLINEGSNGGDSSTYSTPDWDKHSSSNASEVSVACLQDKINQMQETHYSTNEELQATLQELTDLQRQLTELQQENERLNEEKTLMFDSLCRQTERLNDSRSEVESLKQLLYREKEETEHFEPAVEREQTLVELLKSVQEEREELLLKIEQLNNDLQEAGAAIEGKDDRIVKLSERIRTLECSLDAKQSEQKLLDQELVQSKHQCNGKQIEINRLTDLLDNARTKINELEQDRALIDKSELDELLDIARKEKDSLESELAHLKEQLAISNNEIEKLKEQVYVLQEECKVTRNNARTTQSDLEYKCEKLLKDKNSLSSQIQEYQEALNELQVQSQCQLDDKRQLSAVLSETQRNLSETERKNLNLLSEIEELRKLRAEENEEWEKFQNDLLTSVRVANDFKTEAQQELQRMILENKSYRDRERQLRAEIEKLKGDKTSDQSHSNYHVSPGGKISAKDFILKLPNSRRSSRLSKVEEGTKAKKTVKNEKVDVVTVPDGPTPQGVGQKVRKREKKLPKRRLKSLSVEEEMLLKCLNNFYENIDRNKPISELNKSETAIVTLKEIFDDENLKIKPSISKPKDQLAISKPLLDSVFKNPKLKDVIYDPNIMYVDAKNMGTISSSLENAGIENIDPEIHVVEQEDLYLHSSSESLLEQHAGLNLYRSPVVIDLTSELPIRVNYTDLDFKNLETDFGKKAKSVDNFDSQKRENHKRKLSQDLSVSLPAIESVRTNSELRKDNGGPGNAFKRITKSYDDITFSFDIPLYINSVSSSSETFSSAELNLDTGHISYNLKTGEFIFEENKLEKPIKSDLATLNGDSKETKKTLNENDCDITQMPKNNDAKLTQNADSLNRCTIENRRTEIEKEDSYSSITNKFKIIKRLISEENSSLPELNQNTDIGVCNSSNQEEEDMEVAAADDTLLYEHDDNKKNVLDIFKTYQLQTEFDNPGLNTTIIFINTEDMILAEPSNHSEDHATFDSNGESVNNEIFQTNKNGTDITNTSKENISEELNTTIIVVNTEENVFAEPPIDSEIEGHGIFDSKDEFNNLIIQPFDKSDSEKESEIPKVAVESEVIGTATALTIIKPEETFFLGETIDPKNELEYEPHRDTNYSQSEESITTEAMLESNKIVEDETEFCPSEVTFSQATDSNLEGNKEEKVDITQRFFVNVANSVSHQTNVEESTCEYTMLFEDESVSSESSGDGSDSEYNYKNILRENRFGVTSPLNLRVSYRDVVKEIKDTFRRHSDLQLETQSYKTNMEGSAPRSLFSVDEAVVNNEVRYKTYNDNSECLQDTSNITEVDNTRSMHIQTEDLQIVDEAFVNNSADISISNRSESTDIPFNDRIYFTTVSDINETNRTWLHTLCIEKLPSDVQYLSITNDNKDNDEDDTKGVVADFADNSLNNNNFERPDLKSQVGTLDNLTLDIIDPITCDKDVEELDDKSDLESELLINIQTNPSSSEINIPKSTLDQSIISIPSEEVAGDKTDSLIVKDMPNQQASNATLAQGFNQDEMYPESPSLENQGISNPAVSFVGSNLKNNIKLVMDVHKTDDNELEQLDRETDDSVEVPKSISVNLQKNDVIVTRDLQKKTNPITKTVSSSETFSGNIKDVSIGIRETRPSLSVKSQYITKRQSYPTLDRQLLCTTKKVTTFAQHFERMTTDLTPPKKIPSAKESNLQVTKKKPTPSPRNKYLVSEESDRNEDDSLQKVAGNQNFCEKNRYQTINTKSFASQTFGPHGAVHYIEDMIKANCENSEDTLKPLKAPAHKSDHSIKKDDVNLIHRAQPFSSIPGLGGVENLDKFPRSHPTNFTEPSKLPTTSLYLEAVSYKPTYSDIPRPIENKIYDNYELKNNPNLPNFEELGSNPKEVEESLDSHSFSNLEFVPLDESTRPVFDKNLGVINNFLLHEKAHY